MPIYDNPTELIGNTPLVRLHRVPKAEGVTADLAIPNGVDMAAREVTSLHAGFTFPYKIWLSALGHLGWAKDAVDVRARLIAMEPDFNLITARERAPFQPAKDLDHYVEGLRKAGLV